MAPDHGRRGAGAPVRARRRRRRTPVPVALDVRFDAVTPAIGTDGQPSGGPKSAEAAAAAGTVGKGHLEQAGRWTGTLTVDGTRHEWHGAHGNRDRSWGPRRWGGPKMWRWFSINIGEDMHFGGIRLGTDAGDLHRGWVWDGTRATSVAEWRVRTELADDGVTHRVVHLDVVDKSGRTYPLRGDVLRVADIGRAGGTMVNEGLARWTYEDPTGAAADRLRHLRVPAPARRRREACRPRRVGMAPRLSSEELAAALGRQLGGTVHDLRRLSGGASRVTSAFELRRRRRRPAPAHPADGPRRRGAQRTGADGGRPAARRGRRRRAGARRGRPGRGRRARGELAGGGAAGGRDDPAQDPARRRMGRRPPRPDRPGRARAGRHPHHRPGGRSRACRRPTRWATPCPSSMPWARSGPRSSSACAGWRPTARRAGRG